MLRLNTAGTAEKPFLLPSGDDGSSVALDAPLFDSVFEGRITSFDALSISRLRAVSSSGGGGIASHRACVGCTT